MKILRVALGLLLIVSALSFGWAQDIESGLEGYWSFNETEGTVARDLSGNRRDAVVRHGEPFWVQGKIGGAAEFLGADDFVVPGWRGIGGSHPRTVTFWVNTEWDISVPSGIVGWGLSTVNGTKWHVRLNENPANGVVGAIRTEIQGTFIIGTTPINDGQWYHVASVLMDDGLFIDDIRHYINGVEEVVSGMGANINILIDTAVDETGTEVEIGSRLQGTSHQYFIGMVDEVRIYSRALSPTEIQALAAQGETLIDMWELY